MEIRKISLRRPRSVEDPELGHFKLLFRRGRQRNVQRFITHVHTIVLLIKPFVLWRSSYRRRRGLLKAPYSRLLSKILEDTIWIKIHGELNTFSFHGDRPYITVFGAILTGRQVRQKLQCLYGNPMANNFSHTQSGSGMQSRNMVGPLYLLLYLFYQVELFLDHKTWRPALP